MSSNFITFSSGIIHTPLEQFEIIPIIPFSFGIFDFSITNEAVILGLIFFLLYFLFVFSTKDDTASFFVVPHRWQIMLEGMYNLILSMISDNIASKKGQYFFPFVLSLFGYILMLNLIGLVPYSFTLTSHLIVTFALALFIPGGTSFVLALLLVPIEVISFVFKPISLSIRLFANMMAGHTLLKVIAGFAWSLSGCTGIFFLLHYVPLLILIPLFGLELGVALIQAFVFSILTCIYLNDSINLH